MGNAARTRRASARVRRARAEGSVGGWGPLTKQQRQIEDRRTRPKSIESYEKQMRARAR
jgi:hypothetical protein